MNLMKPVSFLLTSVVFLGTTMAADKATPAGASEQSLIPIAQNGSDAVALTAPGGNSYEAVIGQFDRTKRVDRRASLSPSAGVCFTMRSYKVKRTARFRDDENGAMTYS